MSVTQSASRTARKAGNSRSLELLTRGGFIGYGLFHLAIAWLALQIALGHPRQEGDQSGAFRLLQDQPGGKLLLIVVIVGLAAMAVWQLLLAAVGHREESDKRRVAERLMSLCRTVVYGALTWTAIKIVQGAPTSSAKQQENATAGVLGSTGGRFLVGIAGVIVVGIGIGMIVYGVRRSFEKRLRIGAMSGRTREVVTRLGQVGYAAKGVAFGIVGVLLVEAATSNRASRSRGLDAALHTISKQPFGRVLLIVVAVGFAAYGVYCFCQAKYRKV